jgi:hypothetical protein
MNLYTFHEVDKSIKRRRPIEYVINEKGCWECVSHKPSGCGYIVLKRRPKSVYLHRAVYEQCKGEIPEGLGILHSCDNPICFNPDHLSVGDQAANMRDKTEKNRQAKGETSGKNKLMERDVEKILCDSRPRVKIAEEYGVHHATISKIKKRQRWRHVMVGKR